MTVASVSFLGFLLIVSIVFYLIPVKHRWIVLLIGSLVFYALAGDPIFLPLIVLTSLVVWLGALALDSYNSKLQEELDEAQADKKAKKEMRANWKRKSRRVLLICVIVCIGILCMLKFGKYAVKFINNIAASLGSGGDFEISWLVMPIGISYYTFSIVGYILDVYWKRYGCERNFFRFFLYTIYFPHILQGPIARYNLSGQELKKDLYFDSKRVAYGAELMIWGFFKKLVIADRLSIFVNSVYDGSPHAGSIYIIAMLFDAFMVYMDFSGYMDIVKGASQIFGVELEENFNHPFFSRSVTEFWRRWHISLGAWFRDYVYYPLTVSKWVKGLKKSIKKHNLTRLSAVLGVAIPCIITWVLTGLWHGTGKTYVCWGIYYGVLITISVAFQPEFSAINKRLQIKTDSFMWRLFQMLRTFCIFMGGRLLTAPGGLHKTLMVISNIFFNFQIWQWFDGSVLNYGINGIEMALVLICLVILWAVSMMQERFSVRDKLAKRNIVVRWVIIYAAIFAVIIFGVYGSGYDATSFIYTQY